MKVTKIDKDGALIITIQPIPWPKNRKKQKKDIRKDRLIAHPVGQCRIVCTCNPAAPLS